METAEKVVEAYVRYVKKWFTVPNIVLKAGRSNNEIDLLAADLTNPKDIKIYHIEVTSSIAQGWKLGKAAAIENAKDKKFFIGGKSENAIEIRKKLKEYGFFKNKLTKKRVIVAWEWDESAKRKANDHYIELWSLKNILIEISGKVCGETLYLRDETMRTLQLYTATRFCSLRRC